MSNVKLISIFCIAVLFWVCGSFIYSVNDNVEMKTSKVSEKPDIQINIKEKQISPFEKTIRPDKPVPTQKTAKNDNDDSKKNAFKEKIKSSPKLIFLENHVKKVLKNYLVPLDKLKLNFTNGEYKITCDKSQEVGDWPGPRFICKSTYRVEAIIFNTKEIEIQGFVEGHPAAIEKLARDWMVQDLSKEIAQKIAPLIYPKKNRLFLSEIDKNISDWWHLADQLYGIANSLSDDNSNKER